MTLYKDRGGVDAYISVFKNALTRLEEVRNPDSENLKDITFLNDIVDMFYSAQHDIITENDFKTYTHCILALSKRVIDTEESCKCCCPLRRVAA